MYRVLQTTKQGRDKYTQFTHPLSKFVHRFPIPEDIFRLSRDTIYYGLGKGMEGLAVLVLVPVLTRVLAPADFGVWDISMTFLALTTTVASFGLEAALAASYFQARQSEQRLLIASTALQFRVISSVVIAFLFFIFAPVVSTLIFDSSRYAPSIRIVAATIPFFLIVSILKQLLRIDFAPGKFNVLAIGNAALYTALGIFLVTTIRLGVNGVLLSALIAGTLFSLIGVALARKSLSFTFSCSELKSMLMFGLPLVPSLLAYWVIDFSDRYFLTHMTTLAQVGIYSVGAKVSSMVILLITPFQMAWVPLALSVQFEPDAKEKYSKGFTFFLFAALTLAAGIVIFQKFILMILAQPEFYEAEKVIALLVSAAVAFGCFLTINIGCIIRKKTILTSYASGTAAALNLILNLLLIPRFQIVGAAVATLIAYASSAVLLYVLVQREYRIPYDISRISKLIIIAVVAMAIGALISFRDSPAVDVSFRIILLALTFLLLLRVFTERVHPNAAR